MGRALDDVAIRGIFAISLLEVVDFGRVRIVAMVRLLPPKTPHKALREAELAHMILFREHVFGRLARGKSDE